MYYISVCVNNGDDFYLLLGDFLDNFYLADSLVQAKMIAVSPVNMKLSFMYKSPSEFKHRNLFVDENVLMRV